MPNQPFLLLISPSQRHPFDAYLDEILLIEGYHCRETRTVGHADDLGDLAPYALIIVSAGAAEVVPAEVVLEYVTAGGRAILIQPPREWTAQYGLTSMGACYSVARDAYLQMNAAHPWLAHFPATDLQVPGEMHVNVGQEVEALAFVAGQRGQASPYPAVALRRHGQGSAVVFAYDLAETIVLLHQGRPEKSSTGADPDSNRDGKFTGDDAFEGMRDYDLRHVPQADVHQDLLVRCLRGLMAGAMPLPRLWHFPGGAPGLLFVDGDGDAMIWDDLEWVVAACDEFGARYTLYLMTEQIEAFEREQVAAMRRRGHEFGVHPWVGLQPSLTTWTEGLDEIVGRFVDKFGYESTSLRAHSCVFPGWDENPRLLSERGLRLETSFAGGYRFVSGYLNGSGLPVRFIGRDGRVIDCFEHSTIQTEDGSATTKCLLPPLTEEEALRLALELMDDCGRRWHGVFHPYFHPINLAGRGSVPCRQWFRGVLQGARERGLPSVNATQWLEFSEARLAAQVEGAQWEEPWLRFSVTAPRPMDGLTIMLPPQGELTPCLAHLPGERRDLQPYAYEGLQWFGVTLDLAEGETATVAVEYR